MHGFANVYKWSLGDCESLVDADERLSLAICYKHLEKVKSFYMNCRLIEAMFREDLLIINKLINPFKNVFNFYLNHILLSNTQISVFWSMKIYQLSFCPALDEMGQQHPPNHEGTEE